MTVQQIIQSAMRTGVLTSAQEHELNVLLFKQECSAADLFLLRRLHRCLRQGSIRQVQTLNPTVVIGRFGAPLRLLPDPTVTANGGEAPEAPTPSSPHRLRCVSNPKVS